MQQNKQNQQGGGGGGGRKNHNEFGNSIQLNIKLMSIHTLKKKMTKECIM